MELAFEGHATEFIPQESGLGGYDSLTDEF